MQAFAEPGFFRSQLGGLEEVLLLDGGIFLPSHLAQFFLHFRSSLGRFLRFLWSSRHWATSYVPWQCPVGKRFLNMRKLYTIYIEPFAIARRFTHMDDDGGFNMADSSDIKVLAQKMDAGFASVLEAIGETNQRLDQTNERIDQTNERLDQTNERIDQTNGRLDKADSRFDAFQQSVNERFDQVKERFDKADRRFEAFQQSVNDRFDLTSEQLSGIHRRLDESNARIGESNARIDEMKYSVNKKLDGLIKLVKSVDEHVVLLDKRVGKLEKRVDRIEDHLKDAG